MATSFFIMRLEVPKGFWYYVHPEHPERRGIPIMSKYRARALKFSSRQSASEANQNSVFLFDIIEA